MNLVAAGPGIYYNKHALMLKNTFSFTSRNFVLVAVLAPAPALTAAAEVVNIAVYM